VTWHHLHKDSLFLKEKGERTDTSVRIGTSYTEELGVALQSLAEGGGQFPFKKKMEHREGVRLWGKKRHGKI